MASRAMRGVLRLPLRRLMATEASGIKDTPVVVAPAAVPPPTMPAPHVVVVKKDAPAPEPAAAAAAAEPAAAVKPESSGTKTKDSAAEGAEPPSGLQARKDAFVDTAPPPPPQAPKSRGSPFFGGFFYGLGLAAVIGFYFLKDDYEQATNTVTADMQKLTAAVNELRDYVQRIESVERELKRMQKGAASKDDLDRVRTDALQVQDTLHAEHHKLQSQVWSLEQDVVKLINSRRQ